VFHPYVFFSNGQCRAALERYHEIFGGDLQIITNDSLPEGAEPMPGAEPHHVMHGAVSVGGDYLMASDDPTGDGGPKVGVAVSCSVPDEGEGKRVFEALADGGEVTMPWAATFFSPGFGTCTDRFGVQWMVDVATGQQS
jgi:PhnB protein